MPPHRVGIDVRARLALDDRDQGFAVLVVGNAEDRAVDDTGQRGERGLDLGRVDVDPAGQHHVGRAVAQVQPAVGVDEADVPDRDQPVALDLRAGLGKVDVREVRVGGLARVDAAGGPRRALGAVVADDAQRCVEQRPADRARVRERLLGADRGDPAELARRVGLVHDRAEPVDHRALGLRRAGRAGGQHEAQRAQVVRGTRRLGQAQQPVHHRRHQVQVRDAVPLDRAEQGRGVEARLEAQPGTPGRREQRVRRRRRVVERRRDQAARVGPDAEHRLEQGGVRGGEPRGVGRRGRGAAHALRRPVVPEVYGTKPRAARGGPL